MCFYFKSKIFEGVPFDANNTVYTVVSDEHDNLSSIKSSKDFTRNSQQIKIKKGVYIFIVAQNIEKFNLKKFNKIDCSNVPPLGKWLKNENCKIYSLKEGQIFYIGSNKEDCTGRCFQHINCDKKSGNDNLRLEYRKRKFIKKFLKVMFISCDALGDEKEIEKDIRNKYTSFFGQ